jgi:hypothetical protein
MEELARQAETAEAELESMKSPKGETEANTEGEDQELVVVIPKDTGG